MNVLKPTKRFCSWPPYERRDRDAISISCTVDMCLPHVGGKTIERLWKLLKQKQLYRPAPLPVKRWLCAEVPRH